MSFLEHSFDICINVLETGITAITRMNYKRELLELDMRLYVHTLSLFLNIQHNLKSINNTDMNVIMIC